jgi:hypothetical protein
MTDIGKKGVRHERRIDNVGLTVEYSVPVGYRYRKSSIIQEYGRYVRTYLSVNGIRTKQSRVTTGEEESFHQQIPSVESWSNEYIPHTVPRTVRSPQSVGRLTNDNGRRVSPRQRSVTQLPGVNYKNIIKYECNDKIFYRASASIKILMSAPNG